MSMIGDPASRQTDQPGNSLGSALPRGEPRMAARKKRTTGDREGGQQGPKPAKKPTPLGTDTALTLPTSKSKSLSLTYWDVWFALVAVRDFGGDCGRLAE